MPIHRLCLCVVNLDSDNKLTTSGDDQSLCVVVVLLSCVEQITQKYLCDKFAIAFFWGIADSHVLSYFLTMCDVFEIKKTKINGWSSGERCAFSVKDLSSSETISPTKCSIFGIFVFAIWLNFFVLLNRRRRTFGGYCIYEFVELYSVYDLDGLIRGTDNTRGYNWFCYMQQPENESEEVPIYVYGYGYFVVFVIY